MARDSVVLQLRLDERLKSEFAAAAHAQKATPSEALRTLMEDYIRDNRRREAQRQSHLVATAPDATETMDELARVQEWLFD